MQVRVRLDDAAALRVLEALKGREDRMKHLRPAFDAVADDFLEMQRVRFAGGAGWEPLSAAYAVRKARGGRSPLPLAGGDLEKSMTTQRAKFSLRRIGKTHMVVGTRDPVANLHNSGTRGRLPKRKLVVVRAVDRARWGRIFSDHLAGTGRRLGL